MDSECGHCAKNTSKVKRIRSFEILVDILKYQLFAADREDGEKGPFRALVEPCRGSFWQIGGTSKKSRDPLALLRPRR